MNITLLDRNGGAYVNSSSYKIILDEGLIYGGAFLQK